MNKEAKRETRPTGTLAIQTIAMPQDANWNGDIFGGWLVSQMDLACGTTARAVSKGRVATVAIDSMSFLRPVPIGALVTCYTRVEKIGRSSMRIHVEAWIRHDDESMEKVTDGLFTFVAIDENERPRAIPTD